MWWRKTWIDSRLSEECGIILNLEWTDYLFKRHFSYLMWDLRSSIFSSLESESDLIELISVFNWLFSILSSLVSSCSPSSLACNCSNFEDFWCNDFWSLSISFKQSCNLLIWPVLSDSIVTYQKQIFFFGLLHFIYIFCFLPKIQVQETKKLKFDQKF